MAGRPPPHAGGRAPPDQRLWRQQLPQRLHAVEQSVFGSGGERDLLGLDVQVVAVRVVVGVEVEASSPFTISLEAGRITEITPRLSLADGLIGNLEPGTMTFPLVKQVVDYVVTISEDDLARAMKGLATEERLIVEGSGAAAVAATGVPPT